MTERGQNQNKQQEQQQQEQQQQPSVDDAFDIDLSIEDFDEFFDGDDLFGFNDPEAAFDSDYGEDMVIAADEPIDDEHNLITPATATAATTTAVTAETGNGGSSGGESNEASMRHRLAGASSGKAGLNQAERERIEQIIYEASKGSPFYENEERKDERLTHHIAQLRVKLAQVEQQARTTEIAMHEILLGGSNETRSKSEAEKMIAQFESKRDLTRTIVHVDMDMFFAAVEMLDNPDYKSKPMAVGGMMMLSTANYEARKYGVRSGMPGFIGKKLCPDLILVKPRYTRYNEISKKMQSVLRRYDPNPKIAGCDEAYIDITALLSNQAMNQASENGDSPAGAIIRQMRLEIFDETGLTASAGIAPNAMLAKICSDMNKPNGQYELPRTLDAVRGFVHDLSVRKIPGVGRVAERLLNGLDIRTCSEYIARSEGLRQVLTPKMFEHLLKRCLGIGPMLHDNDRFDRDRKSIGVERTFQSCSDPKKLEEKLRHLSVLLEEDLAKNDTIGTKIGLKLKLSNFQLRQRDRQLPRAIYKADEIFQFALPILKKEFPCELRLMGVRLTGLMPASSLSATAGIKKFFKPTAQLQTQPPQLDKDATTAAAVEIKPEPAEDATVTDAPVPQIKVETVPYAGEEEERKAGKEEGKEEQVETIQCPVCNIKFVLRSATNEDINRHIDDCLNKAEIRRIAKSDEPQQAQPVASTTSSAGQKRKNTPALTPSISSSTSSSTSAIPSSRKSSGQGLLKFVKIQR
ncbi:DNA/RNA polymerase [Ramicandelaber brevisporus]|nr:DNA/RNA polymerase [Ramicandelaber brevisporus]